MASRGKRILTEDEETQPSSSMRTPTTNPLLQSSPFRNPSELAMAARGKRILTGEEESQPSSSRQRTTTTNPLLLSSPFRNPSKFASSRCETRTPQLQTTETALCYNFFPTKEEEDLLAAHRNRPKTRDVFPPPVPNPPRPTLSTTKKAMYYNFFPTKEQEELIKSHSLVPPQYSVVEIRDVYDPPVQNPDSPWTITKKLNCYEIAVGSIVLQHNYVFEHVLRHWLYKAAVLLVEDRRKISVTLLDVTEDKRPIRYENENMYLYMMGSHDFGLSCSELIKDRKLKANMEISLYWDAKDSKFCFRSSSL